MPVSWHGQRTISKLLLQPALGLATAPTGVLIGSPAGARLANVELGGVVRVNSPLRTDKLNLTFAARSSNAAGNTASGPADSPHLGWPLCIFQACPPISLRRNNPRCSGLACGSGPVVSIGGHSYRTSVRGTIGNLTSRRPVQLQLCTPGGAITLPTGRQWLTAAPSADFVITSLGMSSQPGTAVTTSAAQSTAVHVLTRQSDRRSLRIGPGGATYVEIHENFNPLNRQHARTATGGSCATAGSRPRGARLPGWDHNPDVRATRRLPRRADQPSASPC